MSVLDGTAIFWGPTLRSEVVRNSWEGGGRGAGDLAHPNVKCCISIGRVEFQILTSGVIKLLENNEKTSWPGQWRAARRPQFVYPASGRGLLVQIQIEIEN